MALFITTANCGCGGGGRILCEKPTRHHLYTLHHSQVLLPASPRRALHMKVSAKKLSKSGRFGSKNKSSALTTKDQEDEEDTELMGDSQDFRVEDVENADDGYFLPKLPGDDPDFWEGPNWDAFGFVIQYLWAFGIVFALIACGIAVATYNEGATDFKETPAYKESVQSQELLEEPEASNSDVFESNPTEVAPSLE